MAGLTRRLWNRRYFRNSRRSYDPGGTSNEFEAGCSSSAYHPLDEGVGGGWCWLGWGSTKIGLTSWTGNPDVNRLQGNRNHYWNQARFEENPNEMNSHDPGLPIILYTFTHSSYIYICIISL